jgi:hypothetical protein
MMIFRSIWALFMMVVVAYSAPEAVVTAPALLPRAESTFCWYSTAMDGANTICEFVGLRAEPPNADFKVQGLRL